MKKILVPTDFSENAVKAAMLAAEIAKRTGGTLYLLHSIEMSDKEFKGQLTLYEKYNNLVISSLKQELHNFRVLIKKMYKDVPCRTMLAGNEFIKDSIITCTKKIKADLVVMGTQGRNAISGALFGSVTSIIMGRSAVPVLAVPAQYEVQDKGRILLATNHFEEDARLLEPVMKLVRALRTELRVISFVDEDDADAADYYDAQRKLADYEKWLHSKFPKINLSSELLQGKRFEYALERYCVNNDVFIVAVVPYQKTWFEKLTRKSALRKLTLYSGFPILSLPTNAVGEEV